MESVYIVCHTHFVKKMAITHITLFVNKYKTKALFVSQLILISLLLLNVRDVNSPFRYTAAICSRNLLPYSASDLDVSFLFILFLTILPVTFLSLSLYLSICIFLSLSFFHSLSHALSFLTFFQIHNFDTKYLSFGWSLAYK